MIKKAAKCEICKKKFTGINAGKHTKETGHNKWELLKPKEEQMIKPKILSDEKILSAKRTVLNKYYPHVFTETMKRLTTLEESDKVIAQAQNDYCYKEMLGQFKEWVKNNATDAIAVKDSDTTQQMIIRAIPEDKFKALQSQLGEG